MRNITEFEFKLIENEAIELNRKCDITTESKQHKIRKRKIFHDEIVGVEGLEEIADTPKQFIVECYIVSLDSFFNRTSKRFE